MSETQRAQLLSRWLEQSPGEGVPDDLDDDVVEAVLALRPDLAPAPRLEVMDILDSLTEGPLAGPDAIPSPEEEGGMIPGYLLSDSRQTQNRKWACITAEQRAT